MTNPSNGLPPSLWAQMPPEILQKFAEVMDGKSSAVYSKLNTEARASVASKQIMSCRNDSLLPKTYALSRKPSQEEAGDQYWLTRADSLVQKTKGLAGGAGIVQRSLETYDAAPRDCVVQRDLAQRWWGAQASGLIALIRNAQGGEEYLTTIQHLPDIQKAQTIAFMFREFKFPKKIYIVHLVRPGVKKPWFDLHGIKQLVCIPEQIRLIPSEQFILSNNKLNRNSFPPNAVPPNIQTLDVSFNEMEEIPEAIGQMVTLRRLLIGYQRLDKSLALPANSPLWRLEKLTYLDLSSNLLTDLPDEMQALVSLRELCLRGNRLEHAPAVLGCLPQLETLDLQENFLSFEALAQFILYKKAVGTERLRIQVDLAHVQSDQVQSLMDEIADGDDYRLFATEFPPAFILEKRNKDIETTQPLEDF